MKGIVNKRLVKQAMQFANPQGKVLVSPKAIERLEHLIARACVLAANEANAAGLATVQPQHVSTVIRVGHPLLDGDAKPKHGGA